jgi:hypothetical protein
MSCGHGGLVTRNARNGVTNRVNLKSLIFFMTLYDSIHVYIFYIYTKEKEKRKKCLHQLEVNGISSLSKDHFTHETESL